MRVCASCLNYFLPIEGAIVTENSDIDDDVVLDGVDSAIEKSLKEPCVTKGVDDLRYCTVAADIVRKAASGVGVVEEPEIDRKMGRIQRYDKEKGFLRSMGRFLVASSENEKEWWINQSKSKFKVCVFRK